MVTFVMVSGCDRVAGIGGVDARNPTRLPGPAMRIYSGRPRVQHSVQRVGGDRHLGCLPPVRLRSQSIADDALPSRDVGLHESAPAVPQGPLPAHAAALRDTS
jgi:hypothetical protein